MYLWRAIILTFAENDKVQILLRNAKQILNVVTATFPSFEAEGPSSGCNQLQTSVEELACEWRSIVLTLPNSNVETENIDEWITAIVKVISTPGLYSFPADLQLVVKAFTRLDEWHCK